MRNNTSKHTVPESDERLRTDVVNGDVVETGNGCERGRMRVCMHDFVAVGAQLQRGAQASRNAQILRRKETEKGLQVGAIA